MRRTLVYRWSSAAGFALLFALSACDNSPIAENPTVERKPLKPSNDGTAFFDRPAALETARHSAVPSPVIVLLEKNPWLMVTGSDSPIFALYDDGTVIFREGEAYKALKLNRSERDRLTRRFEDAGLADAAGAYEASAATDQPEGDLLIYGGGTRKPIYISVYGSLDSVDVRSALPGKVVSAFDELRHFASADARAWLPEKVEVMIWPYEYAPEKSIAWPAKWPGLNDPTTRKRGDAYSIFVPSSELESLQGFLATRAEKGAVVIDGRKWAVRLRLPFPHENLWMSPKT